MTDNANNPLELYEFKGFSQEPWTLEHDADGDFVIFAGKKIVAITDKDLAEDEANGTLMRAAPDLLRELTKLRERLAKLADKEWVGRIMHESWSWTKRTHGFHGPNETCTGNVYYPCDPPTHCTKFHADLIPWEELPEAQKDINRHAFDAVLAELGDSKSGGCIIKSRASDRIRSPMKKSESKSGRKPRPKQCQQTCKFPCCDDQCAYVGRHGKLLKNVPWDKQLKHACLAHNETQ